jgi:hypothetical protein
LYSPITLERVPFSRSADRNPVSPPSAPRLLLPALAHVATRRPRPPPTPPNDKTPQRLARGASLRSDWTTISWATQRYTNLDDRKLGTLRI